MLVAPDDRTLAALARFQNDADWEVVVDWLEGSKKTLQEASAVTRDDVTVRWTQGALQALGEFLSIAQQAPEAVFRSRQRKPT